LNDHDANAKLNEREEEEEGKKIRFEIKRNMKSLIQKKSSILEQSNS
jgi:hypothetical protein